MHKLATAAAVAAACGAVALGAAAPAWAAPTGGLGGSSIRVTPATVQQGSLFYLQTTCTPTADYAALSSPLWTDIRVVGHPYGSATVNVGKTVAPGTYEIALLCLQTKTGKYVAIETGTVVVKKADTPVPPPPPAPPAPPHGATNKPVIIHTGFGGMARSVAMHHPAR